MMQSGHNNFAHVTTAELSWRAKLWPDQIIIAFKRKPDLQDSDYEFISFIKWVPTHSLHIVFLCGIFRHIAAWTRCP